MEKLYSIAGIDIVCKGGELDIPSDCRLAMFETDRVTDPYIFEFEISASLPVPRGQALHLGQTVHVLDTGNGLMKYTGPMQKGTENAHFCTFISGKERRVTVKLDKYTKSVTERAVLENLAIEQLAAENSAFVLHSSCIDIGGKALVFTAPSGTGKSTQADLWAKHRQASVINGDRIILKNKNGRFFACGLPFSGSSSYCENKSLPLAAIVYLGQAKENTVRKLDGREAYFRLWEGCSVPLWSRESVSDVSYTLTQILQDVPFVRLDCTPDEAAVKALENALDI